jgi:chemosensory pili system protein ChpC
MSESMDIEALYSLLVPLEQMRLIVPRDCVAEVVGWDAVRHRREGPQPSWLAGELRWDGREIPVLSFERLCGLETEWPRQRARVVVIRCLGKRLKAGYFGVLTRGFPQIVRVTQSALVPNAQSTWPAQAPVLCELQMVGQSPVIPDLEQVEGELAQIA